MTQHEVPSPPAGMIETVATMLCTCGHPAGYHAMLNLECIQPGCACTSFASPASTAEPFVTKCATVGCIRPVFTKAGDLCTRCHQQTEEGAREVVGEIESVIAAARAQGIGYVSMLRSIQRVPHLLPATGSVVPPEPPDPITDAHLDALQRATGLLGIELARPLNQILTALRVERARSLPDEDRHGSYIGTDWREVLRRNVTVNLEFALGQFPDGDFTKAEALLEEALSECTRLLATTAMRTTVATVANCARSDCAAVRSQAMDYEAEIRRAAADLALETRCHEMAQATQHRTAVRASEYEEELRRVATECGMPEGWQSAAQLVRAKLLHYDELLAERGARNA